MPRVTPMRPAGFLLKQETIDQLPTSVQRLMPYAWRKPDAAYNPQWTLSDWQHDLSRLTAVTELCTGALGRPELDRPARYAHTHLVYPPNLVVLHDRCWSAKSIMQLTQLQRVTGWMEPETAMLLAGVAPGLTHLALQLHKRVVTGPYALQGVDHTRSRVHQAADAAAPVVDRLVNAGVAGAVRCVWLVDTRQQARVACISSDVEPSDILQADREPEWVLDARLVRQLSQLPNLGHLKIDVSPTLQGFAALTQLSALTHLDLYNTAWPQASTGPVKFRDPVERLLGMPWAGLAALPYLHTLRVPFAVLDLSPEERCILYEQLVSLPQLRRLVVCDVDLFSGTPEDARWRAVLA